MLTLTFPLFFICHVHTVTCDNQHFPNSSSSQIPWGHSPHIERQIRISTSQSLQWTATIPAVTARSAHPVMLASPSFYFFRKYNKLISRIEFSNCRSKIRFFFFFFFSFFLYMRFPFVPPFLAFFSPGKYPSRFSREKHNMLSAGLNFFSPKFFLHGFCESLPSFFCTYCSEFLFRRMAYLFPFTVWMYSRSRVFAFFSPFHIICYIPRRNIYSVSLKIMSELRIRDSWMDQEPFIFGLKIDGCCWMPFCRWRVMWKTGACYVYVIIFEFIKISFWVYHALLKYVLD